MTIEDLKKQKQELQEKLEKTKVEHELKMDIEKLNEESDHLRRELKRDPVKEARKKKLKKAIGGFFKAIDHGLDNFARNTTKMVQAEFGNKPKKKKGKEK